jgi:hypothetical protein
MLKMQRWNAGIGTVVVVLAGLFSAGTDAQNIPNPTGVCVANCGTSSPAPAPTQSANPGPSLSPEMMQFGTTIGYAIGRSLFQRQAAPDNGGGESARQYLDQWENDDSDVAASDSYERGASPPDHGGLKVVNAPGLNQPEADTNNNSQNTMLRVLNQTTSYVTVSVDGSYGCNTAGGTTCSIPVTKGQHMLRAIRTDTGASFNQSVNIPGNGYIWPLSGS